jgi:hypothetical protein
MSETTAVQVRLETELFDRLESWRRSQERIPPRSVALRVLIEQALESKRKGARVEEAAAA